MIKEYNNYEYVLDVILLQMNWIADHQISHSNKRLRRLESTYDICCITLENICDTAIKEIEVEFLNKFYLRLNGTIENKDSSDFIYIFLFKIIYSIALSLFALLLFEILI